MIKTNRAVFRHGFILSINLKLNFLAALGAAFCFYADMCGGKTHYKRKPVKQAGFQEHRGGIGGDGVQSENLRFSSERHSRPRVCRFSARFLLLFALETLPRR